MENKLWHDLIENPNDLPNKYIKEYNSEKYINIIILLNNGNIYSDKYYIDYEDLREYDDENSIAKWCYKDELINIDEYGR